MAKRANQITMRLFDGHQRMDEASLRKVFLLQLNNIFSVKTYLVANLPLMAFAASFADLKQAILENVEDIRLQLLRMTIIYRLLGEQFQNQDTKGVVALTREAFAASKEPGMTGLETDLSLLVLLRALESIEVVYFSVLAEIAQSMPDQQLKQLLKENLDLALDSKELYELITREYIA